MHLPVFFALVVLSLAAYVEVVERKISWCVCVLSSRTWNELFNPQASVIQSVNWGLSTYPDVW